MKKNTLFMLILSIALINGTHPHHLSGQTSEEMVNRAVMLEEGTKHDPAYDTVKTSSVRTDTTSIAFGNRHILIVEKNGNTDISISDRMVKGSDTGYRRNRPFKGNWQGLEMGLNNYMNRSLSTSLDPGDDFMELRAARSWNVNLNILQYDFAVSGDNIGFVTGLGFEYNNYQFSNDVSITKENREIVPVNYDVNLDKTRFRAIYLNVPLLFELQTGNQRRARRVYFSAGVVGGINIGSNTRVVYKDNTGKNRDKVRDDFYLSPFRYGVSVRTGYRSLNLYANYYPTPLFQKNKGPELYPVAIGFSILGF